MTINAAHVKTHRTTNDSVMQHSKRLDKPKEFSTLKQYCTSPFLILFTLGLRNNSSIHFDDVCVLNKMEYQQAKEKKTKRKSWDGRRRNENHGIREWMAVVKVNAIRWHKGRIKKQDWVRTVQTRNQCYLLKTYSVLENKSISIDFEICLS